MNFGGIRLRVVDTDSIFVMSHVVEHSKESIVSSLDPQHLPIVLFLDKLAVNIVGVEIQSCWHYLFVFLYLLPVYISQPF